MTRDMLNCPLPGTDRTEGLQEETEVRKAERLHGPSVLPSDLTRSFTNRKEGSK